MHRLIIQFKINNTQLENALSEISLYADFTLKLHWFVSLWRKSIGF